MGRTCSQFGCGNVERTPFGGICQEHAEKQYRDFHPELVSDEVGSIKGFGGHNQDTDCTLDDDLQCVVCGVSHSGVCPSCGGRGFHLPTCGET